jgi:hypothetical protein
MGEQWDKHNGESTEHIADDTRAFIAQPIYQDAAKES